MPGVHCKNNLAARGGRAAMAVLLSLLATRITDAARAADFEREIRPLLKEYCLGCHSTAKHKGDLDLERFTSTEEVKKHPKVWQGLIEQIGLGEMPPKEKPQPTETQRNQLVTWAGNVLDEIGLSRAGDPGPVILRRLSNAEYTYTIRDLTDVDVLDPAREFPADSASGEGFMNVGQSLVMSPALITKYFDAAKEVARHAVLLPDGLGFSPSTSQRDWSEERLTAIRSFYARFSRPGGGSSVNLQGIKFDTKDGGVLPLDEYIEATLQLRDQASRLTNDSSATARAIDQWATTHRLSPKYLQTLWAALRSTNSSLLLDPIRAQWRTARPGDAGAVTRSIATWQQALWRFTQVGHIGKRDGPKAWQTPVTPLASAREARLKIPPSSNGRDTTLYLVASDAGDGARDDFALWQNPRLVAAGRPDLPLRDVRAAAEGFAAFKTKVFAAVRPCLDAASELTNAALDVALVATIASTHGVAPDVLQAWLDCLGIGAGEARIDSLITQKMESAQGYDFIKGWTGADALSVIANSSGQHVRVPGNMKPHGVAVHPSPKRRVLIGWRSPLTAALRINGTIQHAHPECGNGVTWAIELRRGQTQQRLAAGVSQGAKEIPFGPIEHLNVSVGDVVVAVIGPRDGNHSCDLTAVDLTLREEAGTNTWDLAKDVSPEILAGNPHADSLGHPAVWNFYSEPDKPTGAESVVPAGSLLARWQTSARAEEKARLATELQQLLTSTTPPPKDSPDDTLYRQLASINGPLFRNFLRPENLAKWRTQPPPTREDRGAANNAWGPDPARFGHAPKDGVSSVGPLDLCVQAPEVTEIRLPLEVAEGCEFVATATLLVDKKSADVNEGSVQLQVLTNRPVGPPRLAAGAVSEQGGKSTWSDGERPVVSDSPILVADRSAARQRIERALDEFRQLFPAALCYTKIVPVDEVVTLTLYYREDEALRRLFLNEAEVAELERLWSELHYVSHDALRLVDAFEQLWQYATQDADPSAFEPMREPIKRRAEEFRTLLRNTQPAHLDGVLRFATAAYRRPLASAEQNELRELYQRLREQEIAHDEAIRLTLARVLVSPAFLYKSEKPGPGEKPAPINDFELATRLSYFLWSSAPDARLREVAAAGRLRSADVLATEARRLLRDARTRRLATEFACAWLHVYAFDELGEKSERHFPTFVGLRGAMYEETIRFFTDLFQRDGSVLDILDADYTFLNEPLAQHYGINFKAVAAADGTKTSNVWQRVDGLKAQSRGGILGQATTLAKQSGASRTSPILRGNWVAEVLLGEKLPRPPKDVPRLPEDEATEQLTVRELTEKHSRDPKCFGCHRRIDPYGYALEGFDAIGRRRERDLGGRPVETRTVTLDRAEVDGLDGLRKYLLTRRRDAFLRQFSRKLLGYALGRGVMLSDGPLLTEMRDQLAAHDYRISVAIETIVRSRQFREIRGQDAPTDD